MAVSALGTLVWRHPLADVAAEGGGADRRRLHADLPGHRLALGQADVGHLVGLGRAPDLGAGAVPDLSRHHRAAGARSTIPAAAARAVAILTLVGVVNLPIIKFSVDWWNTLHQPASVFRLGGADHPSRRCSGRCWSWPSASRCSALDAASVAMRTEIMRRRVRTLTILEAERLDRQAAWSRTRASSPSPMRSTPSWWPGSILFAVRDHRTQAAPRRALEARGVGRRSNRDDAAGDRQRNRRLWSVCRPWSSSRLAALFWSPPRRRRSIRRCPPS